MAYDAETNLLYFGVGNGSSWNPNIRSAGEGDNWFLASIVAVDAETGEYRWHYQTTPGEGWDYTATQHIILADLTIAGKVRKVLMQAPKNGFFYILDRQTGALVSAEPFVKVSWASHVDKASGRPVINPKAKYWQTHEPALVSPSWMGGHNWHPMSFNPEIELVYLPTQDSSYVYLAEDDQKSSKIGSNLGVDTKVADMADDPTVIEQIKQSVTGQLVAWDPVQQKEVWRVQYPGVWNGGVLSTAGGLVFQGSATSFLNAYSATDGQKLWAFPAQTGIVAPPITFSINGEQYVTVSAGWGGIFPLMTGPLNNDSAAGEPINRSCLLTFKLGGNAVLPKASEQMRQLPDFSDKLINQDIAKHGFMVYDRYCINCHGTGAVGGGVTPDLRYSPLLQSADAWQQVVIDGVLSERGMVSFAAEVSAQDAEAVRQYVIGRNQFARSIGNTERLSR